jgi:hypothetical protein
LATCSQYTTAKVPWSLAPSLPSGLANFAMITLNGRPFVFGGHNGTATVNNVYTLLNKGGVWSVRAAMPVALMAHSAVAN